MDWYRWWHGSSTDPKFQMVAKDCEMNVSCVLGLWAVFLEQASSNDPRGSFKPDYEVLSFQLGIDVVTPCNAMKRRGLLHETDGVLHVANWSKRQPKREREDNSTDRVSAWREKQKQNVTPCNATQHQETPRLDKRRVYTSIRFDDFWKVYPKKKSKPDALKAWEKNNCDELADQIIKSVIAHTKSNDWQKDNGQFIPFPATWLNRQGWEEEPVIYKPHSVGAMQNGFVA